MTIHVLPPEVVGKIAAGEVVERPANVAKELIENSLDAGATEIRVEIREGGQRLLRVTDNGRGIPAEEAALAVQHHATSKLSSADDLNHITTFGFRGEALYSIAAVSHLTLSSRHESEQYGVQLRVEGGKVVHSSKAGLPVGTIVSVEHLFFNVPARKKFLRRPATEAGHISAIVQRYALAHPERRFSLVNEGRLVFQSTGSGDVFDVLVKIYGLENARQMVPVGSGAPVAKDEPSDVDSLEGISPDEIDFMGLDDFGRLAPTQATGKDAPSPSPILVSGYVSLPTLTRANRTNIDLFVNRRYIEDRSLAHAVVQAYHTLLPVSRYPIAVIFVEIDPAQVDVNVHPRKTEVRFDDARRVFSQVQKAVRRVLIESATIPDMNLGDTSGQTSPPVWDPETGERLQGWAARREAILGVGQSQRELDLFVPTAPVSPPESPGELTGASAGQVQSSDAGAGQDVADGPGVESAPAAQRKLPPLRVVGQAGTMYIVAEGPEGLYLIDQHAAHERILYEKFMAQRYGTADGKVARQGLLEPLTIHVGDERAGLIAHHLDALAAVGFEIEPFGGDTFLVRAVPNVLAGKDPERALDEILQGLAQERNLIGEELEARLVKMVCKRAAIKAGQILSDIEMKELIRQLEECQSPRTCPHGRPTMIQLAASELEKAFKRT